MRFKFNNPAKYHDTAILIIRIGLGLSYIFIHGLGKITGGPERWERLGTAVRTVGIEIYHPFWGFMASVSEFFGGFLLLIGLFFRPAAALIIITMFFAAANHIAKGDPIARIVYPLELAVVLIALFIMGPGKYSLEAYIKSRFGKKKK